MATPLTAYASREVGYSAREIELARGVVGLDALHGVGYGHDYTVALRAVRVTLREVTRTARQTEYDGGQGMTPRERLYAVAMGVLLIASCFIEGLFH